MSLEFSPPGSEEAKPDPVACEISSPQLIAYRVTPFPPMRIVRAPLARQWMDQTRERFANRCLPLLIANQSGWFILNNQPIRVTWTGGWDPSCVRIECLDGQERCGASSRFGHGVLTFSVPFLFRTPRGYNLLARGPSNLPKDSIQALEGVVETDWLSATFTMNWAFTRPGAPVIFEKDEPICMIVPQSRGMLESFVPRIRDPNTEPRAAREFMQWHYNRHDFMDALESGSALAEQGWQKHYFRGTDIRGEDEFGEHQTRLELREFIEEPASPYPPMPKVKQHPELIETLRRLGNEQIGVDEAFATVKGVIDLYLHALGGGHHGNFVGVLLAAALFPQAARMPPDQELHREWENMRGMLYDGLGTEMAALSLAMSLHKATGDGSFEKASHILMEQKLRPLLPPIQQAKVDLWASRGRK